jgi:hypothetical protein
MSGLKFQNAADIRLQNVHVTVEQGPPFVSQNAIITQDDTGGN